MAKRTSRKSSTTRNPGEAGEQAGGPGVERPQPARPRAGAVRAARPSGAAPARDEIARRAYERFRARGSEPGHDMEDWLEAERQLRRERGVSD